MVMLTPIEITIVLSETNPARDYAPVGPLFGYHILLQALLNGQFQLSVWEGLLQWQAQLTPTQAEQLASLLARLPSETPPKGLSSFDGQSYKLEVLRGDQHLAFEWANQDWQFYSPDHQPAWQAIAALTDYALQLREETRPVST